MTAKRKTSEKYFHVAPENLNCAQAILKAFQKEFNISEEEISEYKAWGGGRAENGICGALFAAGRLLPHEKKDLEIEFKATLGAISCKELKRDKKDCLSCVYIADQLLEKRIYQNNG